MPLALAVAWLLARRVFPGKNVLEGLVHLPLVLPPVAVGYGLLILLGPQSWLGGFLAEYLGIRLAFTWQAAAIAAGVMAFPLMVRPIHLALNRLDHGLEEAAASLGLSRWRVAWQVTLPLALPGILAGLVTGLARALGEFGATMAFAANIPGETRTLPLALYTALQTPGGDAIAWQLALLSFGLALAALLLSNWLLAWLDQRQGRGVTS